MADKTRTTRWYSQDKNLREAGVIGASIYIAVITPLMIMVAVGLIVLGVWWPIPPNDELVKMGGFGAMRQGLWAAVITAGWWLLGMAASALLGHGIGQSVLKMRQRALKQDPDFRGGEIRSRILATLCGLKKDLQMRNDLSRQIDLLTKAKGRSFDGKTAVADDIDLIRNVYTQAWATAAENERDHLRSQAICDVAAAIDSALNEVRTINAGDLATVQNYITAKYRAEDPIGLHGLVNPAQGGSAA